MSNEWNKIYENNIRLDNIFIDKYKDTDDYFKKNAIGFLVELGEFVNETKCFKYWTVKKPDKDKMLEEYADTIMSILFYFRDFKLDIINDNKHYDSNNILDIINETYFLGTKLMSNYNKITVKEIFSNLMYIGELLEFSEEEIITAIKKKQDIVEQRLNSEY